MISWFILENTARFRLELSEMWAQEDGDRPQRGLPPSGANVNWSSTADATLRSLPVIFVIGVGPDQPTTSAHDEVDCVGRSASAI